jgi:predicted nuclease with RNAse H fold
VSVPKARSAAEIALGIDLRSGPRYLTGIAVLGTDLRLRKLQVVRTNDEIEAIVEQFQPAMIAIDAPLGLPEGRCCADKSCPCAVNGIMREVDRTCAAAGYRPFPSLLPSMVKLTLRGIALSQRLLASGRQVIEVYPGMAQDVMGIPRKGESIDALRHGIFRSGVRGIPRSRRVTHDELDAITCAHVGLMHLAGESESMGPGIPLPLILPKRDAEGR